MAYESIKVMSTKDGGFKTLTSTGEWRAHYNLEDLVKFLSIGLNGVWLGKPSYRWRCDKWVLEE